MAININLTLKQLYEVCCTECQKKILDLAASEGAKQAVKDSLEQQLKKKDK